VASPLRLRSSRDPINMITSPAIPRLTNATQASDLLAPLTDTYSPAVGTETIMRHGVPDTAALTKK